MDKQTFCTILECALLNFDGIDEKELISKYKLNPKLAKIGVQLCKYLKSKNV